MVTKWDYTFVLTHDIHPYVRTTRKQQWRDKRWFSYLASQNETKRVILTQMASNCWDMVPDTTHMHMQIVWFMSKTGYHNSDRDNMEKALLDAMQGIVYKNDAWVDSADTIRCPSPPGLLMCIVKIKVVDETWLTARALGLDLEYVEEVGITRAFLDKLEEMEREDEEMESRIL